MKRIKKIGDYYTLEDTKRSALNDLLCDSCGLADCAVRAILKRLKVNRYNAAMNVVRCKSYMPRLEFRDTSGMEVEFNTFRLGKAWADRVSVGQLVALAGPQGVFGSAEVLAVNCGTFEEMDALHGVDNHLAIWAQVNDAPFDLHAVMEKNYGPQRFNKQSPVSVISMKRIGSGASP